jgi:hypothetical protein
LAVRVVQVALEGPAVQVALEEPGALEGQEGWRDCSGRFH